MHVGIHEPARSFSISCKVALFSPCSRRDIMFNWNASHDYIVKLDFDCCKRDIKGCQLLYMYKHHSISNIEDSYIIENKNYASDMIVNYKLLLLLIIMIINC